MLSPGWQDGGWCGGGIPVCRCLWEPDTGFSPWHSVFLTASIYFS